MRSSCERPAPSDHLNLVACGRLAAQKDYPSLLRAFKLILNERSATLRILGTGELRSRLDELSTELGIQEHVVFLGFESNPYKYFVSADIFVMSSIFEGFGNVVVEAMMCGTPVVVTDCPFGPGEILESGKVGELVPVGKPEVLAEKVLKLASNPELMARRTGLGKLRAEDFTVQRIGERYLDYFIGNKRLDG